MVTSPGNAVFHQCGKGFAVCISSTDNIQVVIVTTMIVMMAVPMCVTPQECNWAMWCACNAFIDLACMVIVLMTMQIVVLSIVIVMMVIYLCVTARECHWATQCVSDVAMGLACRNKSSTPTGRSGTHTALCE